MTIARREILAEGEERAYHCTSRCVRQAYLCGFQALTGRNYDHRKAWVRERLQLLSEVFAVDVLGYAVLSDHQHVVPRMVPPRAREWPAAEVARRWRRLRRARPEGERAAGLDEAARVAAIVRDPARVEVLRQRLSSLSWFMAELDEHLARRANAEDGCRGRFWEGRFKARALLDEAALLTGLVYVDLNPIRAGLAETPEGSDYTSAQDRIRGRAERAAERREPRTAAGPRKARADAWLCPMDGAPPERRVFRRVGLDEYLRVLDATGRLVRADKRGAIPPELAPILERLAIRPGEWVGTVAAFDHRFRRMVGRAEQVLAAARAAGRRWFQGVAACRLVFGGSTDG